MNFPYKLLILDALNKYTVYILVLRQFWLHCYKQWKSVVIEKVCWQLTEKKWKVGGILELQWKR